MLISIHLVMLFSLLPLAAVGWLSAAPASTTGPGTPATVVDAAGLAAVEMPQSPDATATVAVPIYDVNHREARVFKIARDGTVDEETRTEIQRMFRCKRTEHQHQIDKGSLALLADVSSKWPGRTIELVSAYRRTDSRTSRHRQARAIDFRIEGVKMTEVRDYIWATHTELGLGWYPRQNFVHMDHRPGDRDYAWTQVGSKERGNPSWSSRVRRNEALRVPGSRVGS
jgi:uncharacterized protein YcbK (DUF882 family)